MIVYTSDNPKAKARGTLHYYSKPGVLFCPKKNKESTFLIWEVSGTPYDTFCNLCGAQVNFMKDDRVQKSVS